MAWDYRNPGKPEKGDGRYNNKFPNTYQVLDCVREHYFDTFKGDLSFNGNNNQIYYGCVETRIKAYSHTSKKFANISGKKPVFTLFLEKSLLGDKDNYVEFQMQKDIFETEYDEIILEFLKKCIKDITTRDFNLVLSRDFIKFMHVPYDRTRRFREMYSDSNHCYYTTEEFIYFIHRLYDNQYFCMKWISPEIITRLNQNELDFLKWLDDMLLNPSLKDEFLEELQIDIGPQLNYVRIKK